MATIVLDDIPEKITAGDSVAWKLAFDDYPASAGWALSYALTKSGTQIEITGGADGDDHLVDLAAADTADWSAGEYGYQAYVTKDAERYQVDQGFVEIRPNLATQSGGYAALPYCFTVRDAIVAVFEARATETQTSIAVGGRQISEMSHAELIDALDWAKKQCEAYKRAQRKKKGRNTGQIIRAIFTE
jgi:hypothetical protein